MYHILVVPGGTVSLCTGFSFLTLCEVIALTLQMLYLVYKLKLAQKTEEGRKSLKTVFLSLARKRPLRKTRQRCKRMFAAVGAKKKELMVNVGRRKVRVHVWQ